MYIVKSTWPANLKNAAVSDCKLAATPSSRPSPSPPKGNKKLTTSKKQRPKSFSIWVLTTKWSPFAVSLTLSHSPSLSPPLLTPGMLSIPISWHSFETLPLSLLFLKGCAKSAAQSKLLCICIVRRTTTLSPPPSPPFANPAAAPAQLRPHLSIIKAPPGGSHMHTFYIRRKHFARRFMTKYWEKSEKRGKLSQLAACNNG